MQFCHQNQKVFLNNINSENCEFVKLPCKDSACPFFVYTSEDPRLVSSLHSGQRLLLDSVPQDSGNFPNEKWKTGSKGNYSTIEDGDISYYVDKQLAIPFIPELFSKYCGIIKENYKDPMEICKPHFEIILNKDKELPTWLRDSQYHREDLLSRQLWKRNQSSFEVNNYSN
jgi:hypothetical protein